MNDSRSKRFISVRTPVVLYEKPQALDSFCPDKCTTDFNEIITNSSAKPHSSNQKGPSTKKSFSTRNTKSMDQDFNKRKVCGQILMNEQSFIVLKTNKFQRESGRFVRENRKSYQEILNKITSRIRKLRSHEKVKQKSFDYSPEDNLHIFRLEPVFSPFVPHSRKRLLSYGGKRY